MTLPGVDRLVRALEAVEEEATDKAVHLAAAEIVFDTAKGFAPHRSGALAGSGRTSATKKAGVVRFGGPRVPWAGPVVGGHGPPRAQGGFVRATQFPFEAAGVREDDVVELFHRRTNEALRRNGLT